MGEIPNNCPHSRRSEDADRSPLLRDAVVGMGANVPIPLTRLKISASPEVPEIP